MNIRDVSYEDRQTLLVRRVLGKGETYSVDIPENPERRKTTGFAWGYFNSWQEAEDWMGKYRDLPDTDAMKETRVLQWNH